MLTKHENIALGHFLHCYPENMTYHQVIDLIRKEEDTPLNNKLAMPCELYENLWTNDLISEIDSLKETLELTFKGE